jgi:hypothetical protein
MRTARSARDANQFAQSYGFDWSEWFVLPIPADGKAPLRNDRAELQSPNGGLGHVDTMLGEQVLDVAVAQGESEIELACWMTMLG